MRPKPRIEPFDWEDLRFFFAAFEAGSLSAAAERLGVAQATMSRRVAALENKVGHILFDRGRTGLAPTDAAFLLQPHAEAMAAAAEDALAALSGLESEPTGVVRFACPPGIATDLVPALLHWLKREHPGLNLEVLSGSATLDLARREADIALRSVRPTHNDLVFRRLPDVPVYAFGTAAYIDSLGHRPALSDVDWIQYSQELLHVPAAQWVERARGERPAIFSSNSFLAMREVAKAGFGAMLLTEPQGLCNGLVPIESIAVELPGLNWYIVVHRAMRRVPRIRAVMDAIDAVLADELQPRD